MRIRLVCLVLALAACLSVASPAQTRKLKIYISADMEGVVGAVTGDQLGPQGFEYGRFREFMTEEVKAAVEAAFEAGATEIVISDSHGNGENLLIERLPKNVTIVRSWPRPLMMMEGIDATFDGVMFLGYHTSTTNMSGVRAHTISSARLADVRLTGTSMPEAGINAAIAGHFNVPVIMISGDDAIVKEATDLLGNVEGAVVKWAISFHSAKTLTPEACLRAYSREDEEGDSQDKRLQAVQDERAGAARCALQGLPAVRDAKLSVDRSTDRRAQHKVHR
jgi:D-amino peptidase